MNVEELIRKLAARGSMEKAPEVGVANRVMIALKRAAAPKASPERPLIWMAAMSSAAAIAMIALSYSSFQYMYNPLMSLLWDMPWRLL